MGIDLVEVRKQTVAGQKFRGVRRPERKVQREFLPPKPPMEILPRRLGGLANTGPLSSGERVRALLLR